MATLHYVEMLPNRESQSRSDDSADYTCRVNLRGNLGIDNAHDTAILMRTIMNGGVLRFILNLENINYVDSTGIGTIIRIKKDVIKVGGELVLYNVPPKVNEVFELVNLKEFVKIFYSEQKALEFLRTGQAED
ncbi:MAG: STAS domain-containing protein [Spirochaetes bacterium]|nr:STAS domain-containing protein [Spirochaetota bacterium]MBU0956901.1 STAS domain-containing protein [Spirochaetota bacterium]